MPLVYRLWFSFFWENNSVLLGQMHPTTRSTTEQNSSLACAKMRERERERE